MYCKLKPRSLARYVLADQALSAVTLCRQGEYEQHTALVRAIAKDDKGKGKGLVGDIQVLLLCTWLFEQAKLRASFSSLGSGATDVLGQVMRL